MTRNTATSPSSCQRCGQANHCAIAAGQPAASCWCMQRPSTGSVAITADSYCLCPHCLDQAAQHHRPAG